MNGYELSRKWFDWSFENPEKISPNHSALYFFAIEHCNRLGWREKFGFPTEMAKDAIGIKSYTTYIKTLNDLVDWGFIKMVEKSKNQYSSNIIALTNFDKALDKALDKAIVKHVIKQVESTCESIVSIDKQINNKLITNNDVEFEKFWDLYNKKVDSKKCKDKFIKLSKNEIDNIFEKLPLYIQATPEIQYRKNPLTWLNGKCWEDSIINKKPQTNEELNNLTTEIRNSNPRI